MPKSLDNPSWYKRISIYNIQTGAEQRQITRAITLNRKHLSLKSNKYSHIFSCPQCDRNSIRRRQVSEREGMKCHRCAKICLEAVKLLNCHFINNAIIFEMRSEEIQIQHAHTHAHAQIQIHSLRYRQTDTFVAHTQTRKNLKTRRFHFQFLIVSSSFDLKYFDVSQFLVVFVLGEKEEGGRRQGGGKEERSMWIFFMFCSPCFVYY